MSKDLTIPINNFLHILKCGDFMGVASGMKINVVKDRMFIKSGIGKKIFFNIDYKVERTEDPEDFSFVLLNGDISKISDLEKNIKNLATKKKEDKNLYIKYNDKLIHYKSDSGNVFEHKNIKIIDEALEHENLFNVLNPDGIKTDNTTIIKNISMDVLKNSCNSYKTFGNSLRRPLFIIQSIENTIKFVISESGSEIQKTKKIAFQVGNCEIEDQRCFLNTNPNALIPIFKELKHFDLLISKDFSSIYIINEDENHSLKLRINGTKA
jgi:hypothetical protein